MSDRFSQFPQALASQARMVKLGPAGIPAMLAHPDWASRVPVMIWLHGRTAYKELDPGRYLRWIRAGFAACAVDLPGHGERLDADLQTPARTPELLETGLREVDEIVAALRAPEYQDVFDTDRLGLGGMSAGGMITLRRLCEPHAFRGAAVEATTGFLAGLYFPARHGLPTDRAWSTRHDPDRIAQIDPMQHLRGWRPVPLLILHSEADRLVPYAGMSRFIDALREHYRDQNADPGLIEVRTWPSTGAPDEHIGFGVKSNEAKNTQTDFLKRILLEPAGTAGQA